MLFDAKNVNALVYCSVILSNEAGDASSKETHFEPLPRRLETPQVSNSYIYDLKNTFIHYFSERNSFVLIGCIKYSSLM